uniref:Uncharacterized protein n=1 Tax=Timema monikensis TaxID=170555 RepID=A0A7R9HTZ1_9NEOP|nr:unnamed protein product [Timema monikensis]
MHVGKAMIKYQKSKPAIRARGRPRTSTITSDSEEESVAQNKKPRKVVQPISEVRSEEELYTWDRGNQLTYPIRYHEIGYNLTKEEKGEPEASAQVQTDFLIYH